MALRWVVETEGRLRRTDPELRPIGGYSGNVRLFIIYPVKDRVDPIDCRTEHLPISHYTLTTSTIGTRIPDQYIPSEQIAKDHAEARFQEWIRRAGLIEINPY